jgi:hAT family C-terminal dimerisation region
LDLHSHEYRYNLDYKIAYSKPYIQQMTDKLLDYIAAAENATNPIPESSCGESIHLHEIKDLYGDVTTSDSQSTQLENIKSAANEALKLVDALYACQDVREDMDVLTWYESVKYKVPKIHRMATYIFSIPHTQIQNEREFSLASVIGRARRASVSCCLIFSSVTRIWMSFYMKKALNSLMGT